MARAIVIEPDVLLMDEPLSALNELFREEMRREVDDLQRMLGVTTIFVTHDQREALSMSDKILVMKVATSSRKAAKKRCTISRPTILWPISGLSNFIKGEVLGVDTVHVNVKIETGDVLSEKNQGRIFEQATQ